MRRCENVTEALESPRAATEMPSDVDRSGSPTELTPSIAETPEKSGEATTTSSEVEKLVPPEEPTLSVTEVPETFEEAAVKRLKVETEVRSENVEREWELPDWFKQRQLASAARHAERRRSGMRLGMWGVPLEARAQSSTC